MRAKTRSYINLLVGVASIGLALYSARQTVQYWAMTADAGGTAIFAIAPAILLAVAVVYFYVAAAYGPGLLDEVTGRLDCAMLKQGSRVMATGVRVRFIRRPDEARSTLAPEHRYVLFIGEGRPWACKQSRFLL